MNQIQLWVIVITCPVLCFVLVLLLMAIKLRGGSVINKPQFSNFEKLVDDLLGDLQEMINSSSLISVQKEGLIIAWYKTASDFLQKVKSLKFPKATRQEMESKRNAIIKIIIGDSRLTFYGLNSFVEARIVEGFFSMVLSVTDSRKYSKDKVTSYLKNTKINIEKTMGNKK